MSFGIQNLGVINQKDAPAIWESDYVDFPPNYVKGRLLIDTTTGAIYLDTNISRLQISNGSNTFVNGLQSYGGIPTNSNIGLGGALLIETHIDITTNSIQFDGNPNQLQFTTEGLIFDNNTGSFYYGVSPNNLEVVVPNAVLYFQRANSTDIYKVLAQKN